MEVNDIYKMTMIKYLLIFLTIFTSHGESDTTLQLPITINPLVQDALQRDHLTDTVIQSNTTFFEHLTFNDMVKSLGLKPLPLLQNNLAGLVVLGLAAQAHGLAAKNFEFLQASKWTVTMSVEELANVSNKITLPLNDTVPLIIIQEAMFKVLEKRFNFKKDEIAERLNTTKDEIYAFLEPGWIKVVNFITDKNILALSTNYSIPPFYIAEALNMSLSELYNLTLPQLEDILVNKIDIIKESSKMVELVSSKSSPGLSQETSSKMIDTSSNMMKISNTQHTTTTEIQPTQTIDKISPQHTATTEILSTQTIEKTSIQHATTSEIQPTQTVDKSNTQHMTTTGILSISTIVPQSSSIIGTSSSTDVSTGQSVIKGAVNTTPTPSLGNTLYSYDMSETASLIDAESNSMAETTSIITTSFVMASSSYGQVTWKSLTSSHGKRSSSSSKFHTSPQLTMTTDYPSYVTTSSHFLKHPQTSSSQPDSSHFVLSTSTKTRKVSTNSRYQQSTNIPEISPGLTSTPDGLVSKTTIPTKTSSYNATSSPEQDNTANTRSEDDIDPVVLFVIPVICVLLLAAISFYICYVDKTQKRTQQR